MAETKPKEKKNNIFESITNILSEIPVIGKEKENLQQKFKYRGIDDVMNALQPLLAKYKVFIVPEILEQIREERTTKNGSNLIYSICKIKYKFYAEDGSFVEAVTIGEGMDSGDKSTNKAMAIAMKYALFQVFCIPTDDLKDPDAETPECSKPLTPKDEKISEEQSKMVYALLIQKGFNALDFLKQYYNISNTKDLKKEQFVQLVAKLRSLPSKN